VVGVDGGTTKTIALAVDERGQVLGAARGIGSNWSGEDVEIPMAVVIETVQQALQQAGLHGSDISVGVFTLAGADWPEDHILRQAVLEKAGICQRVIVKNDSFGGLRAGTRRPYGMVLAVGTGMNGATITPDGREWAFGYYQTDCGAGDIASQVFEAVLRQEDGRGKPTLLTALTLERLNFPTVEAMLRASVLDQISREARLSLCPLAFQAANRGDEVAAGILTHQGLALADYATAMVRRFGMQDLEFDVVLAGSVFKGEGPLLVDTITQAVHRQAPRARIVKSTLEPVLGSALLALDALGVASGDALYARLAQSAPGAQFFHTADGKGLNPSRRRRR
jgi:N-acetylglucosamine kinase-like BadF-type ATPase